MDDKEVKNTRLKELLLKCAKNLDNGCDPMHLEFLKENDVSATECFMLSQQMAVAIRGYAVAPFDLVTKIVVCSEVKSEKERELILSVLNRTKA